MVWMREKKLLTGFFVGVCLLAMGAATAAQAQSFSARGIINKNMAEETCVSEIEQLTIIVDRLKTARDELIACNNDGEISDGTDCFELSPLNVTWSPNRDNPSSIVFRDSDGNTVNTVSVTKGRDGEDAGPCPSGYEPK